MVDKSCSLTSTNWDCWILAGSRSIAAFSIESMILRYRINFFSFPDWYDSEDDDVDDDNLRCISSSFTSPIVLALSSTIIGFIFGIASSTADDDAAPVVVIDLLSIFSAFTLFLVRRVSARVSTFLVSRFAPLLISLMALYFEESKTSFGWIPAA